MFTNHVYLGKSKNQKWNKWIIKRIKIFSFDYNKISKSKKKWK